MRLDLQASRLLTYQAAEVVGRGDRADPPAAMAKYHTGQTYFRCAIDAMSILGGYGYTKNFEAERRHRDAVLYRIVPGQEVLKDTMARAILREAHSELGTGGYAARSVDTAQAVLDTAVSRVQFGNPISKFHANSHKLADM